MKPLEGFEVFTFTNDDVVHLVYALGSGGADVR